MVIADILCTVDGVKAFHAGNIGLRLVPDWPLDHWRHLAPPNTGKAVAQWGLVGHPKADVAFDYPALLACAWGRPDEMFGSMYEGLDPTRRVSRLPGPPYHFMSRVVTVDGQPGQLDVGGHAVVQYDVPRDAWYFEQGTMPLSVLMEAGLQPCGWLAAYSGSLLGADQDLLFRNLDGTMTVTGEVFPDTGTLTTEVRMISSDRIQDMIIQGFELRCHADGRPIFEAHTVFGFFPQAAFENQQGLGSDPQSRSTAIPLRHNASDMLRMLDEVTADDGNRVRAEKRVDPDDWFFKAHFFQDPVQPGSLGMEAMIQLMGHYVIDRGLGTSARLATDRPFTWKYRGQVTPQAERVAVELEVREATATHVVGDCWLSVDGLRIYHAENLTVHYGSEAQ